MKFAALCAVVFGIGGLATAPALTQDPVRVVGQPAPAYTVKIGDLDLRSPAGEAEMMQRVKRASFRVCGGDDRATLPEIVDRQNCRARTMDLARPQMDAALDKARTQQLASVSIVVSSK